MTRKTANHLQYNWWVYIAIAVVAVVLWTSVFSTLAQPKDNQKLYVSVFCQDGFDREGLENDLKAVLPERTQQNLKKINVEVLSPNEGYDFNINVWARTQSADIVLVQQDLMPESFASTYFVEWADATKQVFDGATFFADEGKVYGLLAESESCKLAKYCDQGKFAIFVPYKSANFAALQGVGNKSDDAAIVAIKYLLEVQ